MSTALQVGDRVEVEIGPIANGGHFIARYNGQVIFVRHAITGERALIEITSISAKVVRADAIEILSPSEDRIKSTCEFSGPGKCGGCDFRHIKLTKQLQLKRDVVIELFSRIAKMPINIEIKSVPPHDGENWRTRVEFAISENGHIGFFSARSNSVIEVSKCASVSSGINALDIFNRNWRGKDAIEVAATSTGQVSVSRGGRTISGQSQLIEKVGELKYELSPLSFWQGHVNAPPTLVEEVLQKAKVNQGDTVLDLYGGVGLFAKAILSTHPQLEKLILIESNEKATSDARKNLSEFAKKTTIFTGRVEQWLTQVKAADLVIVDPPRSGTGEGVNKTLLKLKPRQIIYVSCDPASLARDSAALVAGGYKLGHIVGFDLFPNTQHIECVATFLRG